MVVVRSTTRVHEEGKEAAVALPSEVAEAIAMVQSDSPLVAAEGFSKLSHATFNNRELVVNGWKSWWVVNYPCSVCCSGRQGSCG
jgi:hypothetical protein